MIGRYFAATLIAILIAVAVIAYVKGRRDGRVGQLRDSVEAFQNRGKIDNETNALNRSAVCRRLGGVPEQCDELRRMDEAAAGE
ncbi:hypothetical protein [Sinorhizobium sojae]|uniref:hypothetical protein n=1 Tax=Sinorhizobium sojae TaxID=716925 RepID=UPI00054EFE26|nr:hypothetical protein [Sinorhizobium sojae]